MTLVEHLTELRHRVVVSLIAVGVGAAVAFGAYGHILTWLVRPYCEVLGPHHACQLFVTGPLDGLSIRIKVAVFGGVLLASPVVLWQMWRFVTPALEPRERRYAVPFVASSVVLFLLGSVVAYITFPHALSFLASVGGPTLHQIYSPQSYLSLLLILMAVFGLTFELPVILVSLELSGALRSSTLRRWRRKAIVILVAAAAVMTPSSDPFSMLALSVPLCLFYEAAILVGRALGK